MSEEFVIRQPNDMYRRLTAAITGLEQHDDVEGALQNIRMTLWRFDAVRDGADFEEWLRSLFRHSSVRRIEVTDKFANIEMTTSVVDGPVMETVVSEKTESVELAGVLPGKQTAGGEPERALVELKFPSHWNVSKRTIYHHTDGAVEYRKGEKTYSEAE